MPFSNSDPGLPISMAALTRFASCFTSGTSGARLRTGLFDGLAPPERMPPGPGTDWRVDPALGPIGPPPAGPVPPVDPNRSPTAFLAAFA